MTAADASRAVLRAIRGGARTSGAIAASTGLGVTLVEQTVARGIEAGRLEWRRVPPAPSELHEVGA